MAGLTQEIVVTNWQAQYDKAVSLGTFGVPIGDAGRAATFAALTTPQARVLGRVLDPVAEMDSAELVEMVQDRYAEIDNVRQVGEQAAVVAGVSTVVGEFGADAVLVAGNLEVDLAVYVSGAVASGSDLIVAVGAMPAAFNSIEAPHLETLMEAIEHGA